MKIYTYEELAKIQQLEKLQNRMNKIYPFIAGSAFLIAGITLLFIAPRTSSLSCERYQNDQGVCQLIHKGRFGQDNFTFNISDITDVVILKSEANSYQIVFKTKTGDIQFTSYFSFYLSALEVKYEEILKYLDDANTKYLKLLYNESGDNKFIGWLFILASPFIIFIVKKWLKFRLDKFSFR